MHYNSSDAISELSDQIAFSKEEMEMFCTECGKMLPEGSSVCPACGTPVSVTGAVGAAVMTETAETIETMEATAEAVPDQEPDQGPEPVPSQDQSADMTEEDPHSPHEELTASSVHVPEETGTASGLGLCIAGFIFSLAGLFLSVFMVMLIAGLILSGIGVSIAGKDESGSHAGRGLGIAGIVIAIIGILLRIFLISALVAVFRG